MSNNYNNRAVSKINNRSLFHSRVYFSKEALKLDYRPNFDIITPEEIEAHHKDPYLQEYITEFNYMVYDKVKTFLSFVDNSSYYFYPKDSERYQYRNKHIHKYPNLKIPTIIINKNNKKLADQIVNKWTFNLNAGKYIADFMYKLIRFFNQRNEMGMRIIWRKVEKETENKTDRWTQYRIYYELVLVSSNKNPKKCVRIKSREYYGRKNEKTMEDIFVSENAYLLRCLMQFMLKYMV